MAKGQLVINYNPSKWTGKWPMLIMGILATLTVLFSYIDEGISMLFVVLMAIDFWVNIIVFAVILVAKAIYRVKGE